jgi:hypothetical protein
MAVVPYKVNKETPIDFLLAGVRGTLAGIVGGKAAQQQAKQIALENQMKMEELQLNRDSLTQRWNMQVEEIKARKDEIERSGVIDLAKVQASKEAEIKIANLQHGQRLFEDVMNNAMRMELEKQKAKGDEFTNRLDEKKYEETVRSNKATESIQTKNANSLLMSRESAASARESQLDIAEQRVALSQEKAEYEQSRNRVAYKIKLVDEMRKAQTQLAGKKSNATYGVLSRSADMSFNNAQDSPTSMKASQASILAAKYAYDNFGQDTTVNLFIERNNATDKKLTIPYSQYLTMIETKEYPNGDSIGQRELNQIQVGDVIPKEVESQVNATLKSDTESQDIQSYIKEIKSEIDSLGIKTVPDVIKPTGTVVTPKPVATTKPTISVIPTKQSALPDTWDTFIDNIGTMPDATALQFLKKNATYIENKYGNDKRAKILYMINVLTSGAGQ